MRASAANVEGSLGNLNPIVNEGQLYDLFNQLYDLSLCTALWLGFHQTIISLFRTLRSGSGVEWS
ncbi:hypothetical protein HYC85_013036 [Camellia sinensis]|uniref:Uncharacterized protein n=1 Tax=Camellia sinensis TaxID=4442 RepID=A0A7J7HDR5_CAMSI|nr:hypothetical protein HYC85_013036 [Camellia sinensis]